MRRAFGCLSRDVTHNGVPRVLDLADDGAPVT